MNTGIDRALSMKLDPISVSPMDHEKMMMNITRKNQKLHFPCRLSFAVTAALICFILSLPGKYRSIPISISPRSVSSFYKGVTLPTDHILLFQISNTSLIRLFHVRMLFHSAAQQF